MILQGTRKIRAIVCSLAALLSFSLIHVVAALSTPDATSSANRKCAAIVGGGPVGLATAITLSNPPHSHYVAILEQLNKPQLNSVIPPRRICTMSILVDKNG